MKRGYPPGTQILNTDDGLCCIKGCKKSIRTAAFCNTHYMRYYRYGHPLRTVGSLWATPSNRVLPEKLRERHTWQAMLARCYKTQNKNYAHYGARGIKVCDAWVNDFDTFYRDMGPRPFGCSLDRINVDGPYMPSNCRWASVTEQNRNRRDTKLNVAKVAQAKRLFNTGATVADIARRFAVPYFAMYQALKGVSWVDVEAAHDP